MDLAHQGIFSTSTNRDFTESKRIIRDCCIDLHNSIQKWNINLLKGHATILTISQRKLKQLSERSSSNKDVLGFSSLKDVSELQLLSDDLNATIEIFKSIVEKMEKTAHRLKAVCQLSACQHSTSLTEMSELEEIPFLTWPISRFQSAAEELADIYKDELKIKTEISQELCVLTDKSAIMFFEICWAFEPKIDKDKVGEILAGLLAQCELF